MPVPSLQEIAKQLVAPGTGILAADESEGTIAKRFAVIGLPVTFETRRDYREMLFRAHEAMSTYISGVILTEETLKQSALDGTPFVALLADANTIPGIALASASSATKGVPSSADCFSVSSVRMTPEMYLLIASCARNSISR